MNTNISTAEYDLAVDAADQQHNVTDAEAALEALRVAIGSGGPSSDLYGTAQPTSSSIDHGATHDSGDITPEVEETVEERDEIDQVGGHSTNGQHTLDGQTVVTLLNSLSQLGSSNLTILDQMNVPSLIQGLSGSLDLLIKGNRKQAEIVKSLQSHLVNGTLPNIDPILTGTYVLKTEYEDLKTRYDLLNASGSVGKPGGRERKPKAPRAATVLVNVTEQKQNSPANLGAAEENTANGTRKRRSMKLEHLIHKMANRRLGVEYTIADFKTPGSKMLPDCNTPPRSAADSAAGVDEYRPPYGNDPEHDQVKPFIEQVEADVIEAWEGGVGAEEPEVDAQKIKEGVAVYWLRLSKRWAEQQARTRGEIHKDELTRRKQNQYRRQQSLLARRVAAFDSSPLNVCKLRALYRTLLTIDFAPPTNERPEHARAYTPEEWDAYQRLANGGRAPHAHEVIDQFWWSSSARALLQILDVFAVDLSGKMRRKGKPKQPAPVFHLPPELWDRSTLPKIRPKSADGLPLSGQTGVVLFRFQIDEQVIRDHPEWAQGLYDNPPVPDEDILLPNLSDIMENTVFANLKPGVKALKEAATVRRLSMEEIAEVLSRPTPPPEEPSAVVEQDSSTIEFSQDFMAKSLDSLFALNNNPFSTAGPSTSPLPMPEAAETATAAPAGTPSGPSLGSSVRARRQAKRMANELPGGAAAPVAKRVRKEGMSDIAEQIVEKQVEEGIKGDIAFLEAL